MVHPEKGNHANHPGHGNHDCPLRMQINATPYGTSRNGYGCSATGGHCVKSDACESRVADDAAYREENKVLIAFMEQERERKDLYKGFTGGAFDL